MQMKLVFLFKFLKHRIKYLILSVILIYGFFTILSYKNINKVPGAAAIYSIITPRNNLFKNVTGSSINKLRWYDMGSDIYVLSGYLDIRYPNKHFIRFLIISKFAKPLSCIYNYNEIQAVIYQFNENHNEIYGGYIYSCPINKLDNIEGNGVSLRNDETKFIKKIHLTVLKMELLNIHNFTLCVPPMFGHIDKTQLISFIEMNKILGANHFYFYLYSKNLEEILPVLKYYQREGYVTIFNWSVPHKEIWYNGQMSHIHHCLYKNIGKSRYTIFQDLDELVVPLTTYGWAETITKLDNGKHSGYKISSVFIDNPKSYDKMFYFNKFQRSSDINKVRSKCIVHPELIFEQGIHHISKQNVEEMTPELADTSLVLLYHFKRCDNMFGFNCDKYMPEDGLLRKYQKQFSINYDDTIKRINFMV